MPRTGPQPEALRPRAAGPDPDARPGRRFADQCRLDPHPARRAIRPLAADRAAGHRRLGRGHGGGRRDAHRRPRHAGPGGPLPVRLGPRRGVVPLDRAAVCVRDVDCPAEGGPGRVGPGAGHGAGRRPAVPGGNRPAGGPRRRHSGGRVPRLSTRESRVPAGRARAARADEVRGVCGEVRAGARGGKLVFYDRRSVGEGD